MTSRSRPCQAPTHFSPAEDSQAADLWTRRSGDLLAKIAAVDPPAESAVTSVANHGVTVVIP